MDSLTDISKELIKNFTDKSWQEIENIKLQLNSLSKNTHVEKAAHAALNDLLTSYYIFVGRLESLLDDGSIANMAETEKRPAAKPEHPTVIPNVDVHNTKDTFIDNIPKVQITDSTDVDFEPFEYFVDFDEPVGNPLSDKDLYGN